TPLAPDVNFHDLGIRYDASGGDIKNAVIKAAASAASQSGPDAAKKIEQRQFQSAIEDVLAARSVMRQSILNEVPPYAAPIELTAPVQSSLGTMTLVAFAISVIA